MRGWREGSSLLLLTTVLAVWGCTGERHAEGDDDEREHMTGPSAMAPAPAPSPTPAPGATPAPGPMPTPMPTPMPMPGVRVAYVQDVKPILDADCVSCHGGLASYRGTMNYLVPGSASSILVRITQPGAGMYGYLSGNAPAKAETIRSWVVDNGAAETR